MFGGGGRDWSVDVLRCISCFMVCAIHATDFAVTREIRCNGPLSDCMYHIVYRTILGSPTVLFVMVSGIFFLSPERRVVPGKIWRKNIMKMAFAYIFWSLLYGLMRIHYMDPQPEITGQLLIQEWMNQQTHLWYIPMIIGLYILAPIIRPITATYDKKLFAYMIGVFMGGLVLWSWYNWPNPDVTDSFHRLLIDKTPMATIAQYPFWMLFGWIAYTYRPNRRFRILIYTIAVAAVLVGIVLNYRNWDVTYFTMYATTQKFSIIVFFKNTALFYLILTALRDHEFSEAGKRILSKISEYTLIIYLFHQVPLTVMFKNEFLWDLGMSPWIGIWVYAAICYVSGALLAWLFHLAWDPVKEAMFPKKKRSERVYDKLEKKEKRERE